MRNAICFFSFITDNVISIGPSLILIICELT